MASADRTDASATKDPNKVMSASDLRALLRTWDGLLPPAFLATLHARLDARAPEGAGESDFDSVYSY